MMDYKQRKIFDRILDKNNIPHKNTFVQHRNLNEFRGFIVERINPNHRMILYGKLKKKYINDGHTNKIIRVGEIFVYSSLFYINDPLYLQVASYFLGSILVYYFMFRCMLENNLGELINACWNRRKCRHGENSICS